MGRWGDGEMGSGSPPAGWAGRGLRGWDVTLGLENGAENGGPAGSWPVEQLPEYSKSHKEPCPSGSGTSHPRPARTTSVRRGKTAGSRVADVGCTRNL